MAADYYSAFVEEAFIEPIRSVLIVDDDFPTYDEVLSNGESSEDRAGKNGRKGWRSDPGQVAAIIEAFRRRPVPLLVDIHDGTNVSSDGEEETAAHLHQCDLLVLDYELDKERRNDGTRAIEILRKLMANRHFNLVVINTKAELASVFDEVRWGLVALAEDRLTEDEIKNAKELIQAGEDLIEGFENSVSQAIGAEQYFDSRMNQSSYLRTMAKDGQPYSEYNYQAKRAKWSVPERKMVLRYLLRELEKRKAANSASDNHVNDLEWSRNAPKWIKSDSVFVALSSKTNKEYDVLHELREALLDWSPPPSRLFLTRLRAVIDEYGVTLQQPALGNRHAMAYWYFGLLRTEELGDRRWRITESVSRQSEQLLSLVMPHVEQFVTRLIEAEVTAGDPIEICKDHFGVDFRTEKDKTQSILEHNAFVCSMEPNGSHLTTGHVFTMSDESNECWLCLSPACDMVPSQISKWRIDAFGERLPFVAVKLQKVKADRIPDGIDSNRFLFLSVEGQVKTYCFNDRSGERSAPHWHTLFAKERGKLSGDFEFHVDYVGAGQTGLATTSYRAKVVSQLRYEYALNLTQMLGLSLMRIGLDFSKGVETGT